MRLQCLPPKTTREEALKMFKSRLRRLKLGRFLLDTGFYLPYYLFRVEVQNAGKTSAQLLAIDAVTGELDLYSFDSVPDEADLWEVETVQVSPIVLSEQKALALLQERVRREVYQQGFFKIDDLRIRGEFIRLCYVPYWMSLYERNKRANAEVLDAVRGRFEGAKVRDIVMQWFTEEAARRRARSATDG